MTPAMASRTRQALTWLAASSKKTPRTAYAAAGRFKLSTSVVYRALRAQAKTLSRRRRVCPTCGAALPKAK